MRTLTAATISLCVLGTASAEPPDPKPQDRTIQFTDKIGPIAFSPDGKQLAVGRDGAVHVYDFKTMKRLRTVAILWDDRGKLGPVDPAGIAYSPDGKTLAVWKVMPEIQIFNAKTGASTEIVRFPADIEALLGIPSGGGAGVIFSPDGKRVGLLSPEFDTVTKLGSMVTGYLWLIDKKQKSKTVDEIRNALVTPDGKFLGLKMRRVKKGHTDPRLVDLKTGKALRKLDLKEVINAMESRFSNDGRRIAVAGWNRLVVWDTSTGKQVLSFKSRSDAEIFERGIAFSGDAKYVTAASYEYVDAAKTLIGRLRTWRIADGKVVWEVTKPRAVPSVRGTTPDGKAAIYQLGARDQLKFRVFPKPKNGR